MDPFPEGIYASGCVFDRTCFPLDFGGERKRDGVAGQHSIDRKKIIGGDDTSVLLPTQNEQLTLMTCWPIGASDKRMVIVAKLKSL